MIRRIFRRLFPPRAMSLGEQGEAIARVMAEGEQPRLRRRWKFPDARYAPMNKPRTVAEWFKRYGRRSA